nr:MAG TPA: hypothetical protein [Caudoviricetes sp.]
MFYLYSCFYEEYQLIERATLLIYIAGNKEVPASQK